LHTTNRIVIATAEVGGVSAAMCLAVAVTIFAHGHGRVSMQHRIIVGLMIFNAVYSTANMIPLNAMRTGDFDCGRMAMSFDAIRFGRALWFCGKYGLVSFEMLIVGASIRALLRGLTAVPPFVEATLHAACCTVAVLAFVVFYLMCAQINLDGYNTATETEAFTNSFDHSSIDDDTDDGLPALAATSTFKEERDDYDRLVRWMLVVWNILVGVTVILWFVLRAMYHLALRALRVEAAASAHLEANDMWASTRRSAWESRREVLLTRREAFSDMVKPLEPYIAVFVVFAVPAVIMSTTFCQHESRATTESTSSTTELVTSHITYGQCDVLCEFALAFRSLCTVAVYLLPREGRVELVAVRASFALAL
jgi:hypothetical protein